ncbi:MAG: hypothetical protein IIA07_00695 [Proteobacteria bacterium]|nr:hypothetical protein [Pseudomonadota bacterium]
MIKRLMSAAALLVLAGCGQEPDAVVNVAAPLSSGIDVHYMDTSVKPGDDFFRYMNGKWLDETEIPVDKANYGGFVILADDAQENVKIIIEESATGDFAKGIVENCDTNHDNKMNGSVIVESFVAREDDDISADIRDKYVVHIEKMFDLAGLPDAAAAATTIMALETRLAEKNMTKEAVRNRAENYKAIARADLSDTMPEINWSPT